MDQPRSSTNFNRTSYATITDDGHLNVPQTPAHDPETPRTKAQKFALFLPGGTLYAIRFGIAGVIMLFAFTLPYFTYLMGLTGNITGLILAFLLPCYFHIQLKWDVMPMWEKIADVSIIISGVFCSVVGTYRKEGRKG